MEPRQLEYGHDEPAYRNRAVTVGLLLGAWGIGLASWALWVGMVFYWIAKFVM